VDRGAIPGALRYALSMLRSLRRLNSPASSSRSPFSSRGGRSRAFLLGALLTAGSGCGQDVLVARWTLLSDAPDAAQEDEPEGATEGADAGVNHQSIAAARARERARRENNH
jgi:hypothetical protein